MAKSSKKVSVKSAPKGRASKATTDRSVSETSSRTSSITISSIKSAANRAQHRGDVHVVPLRGQWAVRRQGTSKEVAHFSTQAEAIDSARRVALQRGSGLIVHGRDGRVRSKNSFGTDPMPPQGKK